MKKNGRKEWQRIERRRNPGKGRFFLFSGLALFFLAAVLIFWVLHEYGKSDKLYEQARASYVTGTLPEAEGYSAEEEAVPRAEKTAGWVPAMDADLEALSAEYPDVAGWISFEDGEISYPIMYSGDNETYLYRSYNGESTKAGSIFLDGESNPGFSDLHTLIYGHNMRDLSMFGKLKYYASDPGYYEKHPYFDIYTRDGAYRYRIFACEEVSSSAPVYYVYGTETEQYAGLLDWLMRNSCIDTGIDVTPSDHVVTLSTCTDSDENRMIVCGVRTEEYHNGNESGKKAGIGSFDPGKAGGGGDKAD